MKYETGESSMVYTPKSQARLFFTYLKDKTELFLYVKPHDTYGREMIYRRSPSDSAMNLRIQAILGHAGVRRSRTEIWILLYPPEIHTTTMYIPSHASQQEMKAQIRDQIFSNLHYSVHYDWDNYSLQVRDNGNGENMVIVTILGKDVIPRIKELLGENFNRVRFIGDGLQFLNVEETLFRELTGQTYEMILPYDEIYYTAGFRSGYHVESSVLTHAGSSFFGDYALKQQQVYLDLRHMKNMLHQPKIQPIVSENVWKRALLTPAAFPTWFIANNCLHRKGYVNFVHANRNEYQDESKNKVSKSRPAVHLLD